MVDIFDEIKEDLRAERAQALLKRYGVALFVAGILVVAGAAGWKLWQGRSLEASTQVAGTFLDAVRKSSPVREGATASTGAALAEAEAAFASMAGSGPEGYRTLAKLRLAALKAPTDLAAALSLWDQVSADTGADPLLRGLADLLWVRHQVDAGDPAAVEGRLATLLVPGSPWRPLALECQAWLAVRLGQEARARDILRPLLADPAIPDGLRDRASELMTHLGETPPVVQGARG